MLGLTLVLSIVICIAWGKVRLWRQHAAAWMTRGTAYACIYVYAGKWLHFKVSPSSANEICYKWALNLFKVAKLCGMKGGWQATLQGKRWHIRKITPCSANKMWYPWAFNFVWAWAHLRWGARSLLCVCMCLCVCVCVCVCVCAHVRVWQVTSQTKTLTTKKTLKNRPNLLNIWNISLPR